MNELGLTGSDINGLTAGLHENLHDTGASNEGAAKPHAPNVEQ